MKQKHILGLVCVALTLAIVALLMYARMPDPVASTTLVMPPVQAPAPAPPPVQPEHRPPPYKRYRPRRFQQVGLLSGGENGETLPLYGKESDVYRDHWHYYTSTPGEQIYSLPVNLEGRDCTEDVGCRELYGNENLSVFGRDGDYTAKIYRTEQFPLRV
jgi:hypothetical protein